MGTVSEARVGRKAETFFERHAWKILLFLFVIIALFGVTDLSAGASTFESGETVLFQSIARTTWNELNTSSPNVANMMSYLVRSGAIDLFLVGLLLAVICVIPFRRGERWAWYALWAFPLWCAGVILLILNTPRDPSIGIPVPVQSGAILFALSALVLLLSRRRFFR